MSATKATTQPPTGKDAEEHVHDIHAHDERQHQRTILIALDHSSHSDNALQWALKNFIRVDGGDLVVLTTVREPVLVPGSMGMAVGYMDFGDYIAEAEEQARLKAHALIKKYGQEILKFYNLPSASANGKLTVKGIVMRGDPRDELVRKAQELNACALIMGNRGLGAFKRAFLGSVSDYIVHHSAVPVVIVKEPVAAEAKKDN